MSTWRISRSIWNEVVARFACVLMVRIERPSPEPQVEIADRRPSQCHIHQPGYVLGDCNQSRNRETRLLTSFENFMDRGIAGNNFAMLPIELSHARRVSEFGKGVLHKDPFDRMLVAQALVEGIPLVIADAHLDAYGITRIW